MANRQCIHPDCKTPARRSSEYYCEFHYNLRQARRNREASFPKCKCGNTIGLSNAKLGKCQSCVDAILTRRPEELVNGDFKVSRNSIYESIPSSIKVSYAGAIGLLVEASKVAAENGEVDLLGQIESSVFDWCELTGWDYEPTTSGIVLVEPIK